MSIKPARLSQKALKREITSIRNAAERPANTLVVASIDAGIWVLSTVAVGAAVNFTVAQKDWRALVAVATVAFLGGMLFFYHKTHTTITRWSKIAEHAYKFLTETKEKEVELVRAQRTIRKNEDKMSRFNEAVGHANAAIKWFSHALEQGAENESFPISMRRSLLFTMRFFSSLARKDKGPVPRCGLLVRKLDDPTKLVPLIVYTPADDTYVSPSEFDIKKDFSGRLITKFERNSDAHYIDKYLYDYIPDTAEHRRSENDPRFMPRTRHHDKEVISILGNIVYRTENGARIAQGVLNIDSPSRDGLDYQFYRECMRIRKPLFHLINAVLSLTEQNRNLFESLHHPIGDETGGSDERNISQPAK